MNFKKANKRQWLMLIVLILLLFYSGNFELPNEDTNRNKGLIHDAAATSALDDNVSSISAMGSPETYIVTKVTDGDTIKVNDSNGDEYTIRLIGIDSPETKHPQKKIECFGLEASEFLTNLIDNKQVYLEADETQANTDRYGRLLRYVYLKDLGLINLMMVQEGYAYEYTYGNPYKLQSDFVNAQNQASENNLGLWGDVCE